MPSKHTPPNFRIAKSGASCSSCIYFYLTKGWKGLGECLKWTHITDQSLLCDTHLTHEELDGSKEE